MGLERDRFDRVPSGLGQRAGSDACAAVVTERIRGPLSNSVCNADAAGNGRPYPRAFSPDQCRTGSHTNTDAAADHRSAASRIGTGRTDAANSRTVRIRESHRHGTKFCGGRRFDRSAGSDRHAHRKISGCNGADHHGPARNFGQRTRAGCIQRRNHCGSGGRARHRRPRFSRIRQRTGRNGCGCTGTSADRRAGRRGAGRGPVRSIALTRRRGDRGRSDSDTGQ